MLTSTPLSACTGAQALCTPAVYSVSDFPSCSKVFGDRFLPTIRNDTGCFRVTCPTGGVVVSASCNVVTGSFAGSVLFDAEGALVKDGGQAHSYVCAANPDDTDTVIAEPYIFCCGGSSSSSTAAEDVAAAPIGVRVVRPTRS